jgi:hypothetical protein
MAASGAAIPAAGMSLEGVVRIIDPRANELIDSADPLTRPTGGGV